ncbi:MAG: ATP-grasp domain-containing protein [Nanohaloarchaea archaeon]|nr:ATP-grasp domain-containing protein [Candidatus Nanohaloarchaea archaeon]
MNIVSLWDSAVSDWELERPFSKQQYNRDYEHYSKLAEEKDAKLFLAHYTWYKDGRMKKAFTYENGEWRKVNDIEVNGVWDAFKVNDETLEIKRRMEERHVIINRPNVDRLCKDKLETYERFSNLVPETRKASETNIERMIEKYGEAVVKPRDDWGGEGVQIVEDVSGFNDDSEDWLVQEFVDASEGISKLGVEGVHDLRALVVNGEAVTGFLRQPDEGFVSNVHQGGSIEVVELENFPSGALNIVEQVKEEMSDLEPYLMTVDMIYDSETDEFRVLELNSKPGMSFYGREDMKKAKSRVMERIVESFKNA